MHNYLNDDAVAAFIREGFVRIDNAFSPTLATEAVDILWKDIPFERANIDSYSEPVVRLGMYTQPPFIKSVNSPRLHAIFNQLVGMDTWLPCQSVGTFPVRFPSDKQPADIGKHVDVSFAGADPNNYFEWRANVHSKGRALLMLVLYSDVTEKDAPTIVYKGSHIDVAKLLHPHADLGLSFMEIVQQLDALPQRDAVFATGKAGTIYLCHPFMVHAAQAHTGTTPKFMAQPPLLLKSALQLNRHSGCYTPVEQAIRLAIE